MRTLVAILLLACVASAVSDEVVYRQFQEWSAKYGKAYDSVLEHTHRFENFKSNVALVKHLNRQSRSATFALNQFADLSQEEFEAKYLHPIRVPAIRTHETFKYDRFRDYPESKDWRSENAVNEVQDQGSCGSCWAFSVAQNLESVYFLKYHELPKLSEQQLVDCDHECMIYPGTTETVCDEGCNGGLMPNAMTYAIKNGMMTEKDYGYKGRTGTCAYVASKATYKFEAWKWVDKDENAMVAALNDVGPLSIGVCASSWSFYSGGIFNSTCTSLNHGVGLIGYGTDGTHKYWIIRNSWGKSWGEKGYIRLARGFDRCKVNDFVSTIYF